MKYANLFRVAVVGFVLAVCLIPVSSALAASWSYEQDFEGLNTGDLHSQDSWTNNNNPNYANLQVSTETPFAGTKGIKGTSYYSYQRTITAVDSGTFYFVLNCTPPTSGDGCGVTLRNASTYSLIVRGYASGANVLLKYYSNGSYVDWNTVSASTHHVVGVQLDLANHQYKLNLDNGSWSGWLTTGSAANTDADRIQISQDTGTTYIDEFSLTYPTTTTEEEPPASTTTEYFDATATEILIAMNQSAQEIVLGFCVFLFLGVGYGSYRLASRLNRYD